jgi:ribose transport system permease protein
MKIVSRIWAEYRLQICILVLVIAVVALIAPNFRGESAVYAVLERLVPLGIIAAGVAVTMIAGEFDLSVASMAALAGAVAVTLSGLGILVTIAIVVVMGIVIGLAQGWLIARLGINSLVLTVTTLILLRGATWLVTGGAPIAVTDYAVTDALMFRMWVFSPLSITALVVIAAIGVFLSRTRPGKAILATGGAREEARAAGVPVNRALIVSFAISGGCGALAGSLSSLRSGSATADGFSSQLLLAVTAALVGGIALSGGKGGMVNVLFGVFITSVLATGLAAMGVKSFVSELFTGVLLLVVIALDYGLSRLARSHRLRSERREALAVAA